MRFMFWNIRGLGKAHKRGMVLSHILLENLDIVCIQEIIKHDFCDRELKELSGLIDFT